MQILCPAQCGQEKTIIGQTKYAVEGLINFLEAFYRRYREDLVHYGLRFNDCQDSAEDLFEDSHDKICAKYPDPTALDYVKLMKASMKNRNTNQVLKGNYLTYFPFPELFSPPPLLELEEEICRREEFRLLQQVIESMKPIDQLVLRGDLVPPECTTSFKHQSLQRFKKKGEKYNEFNLVL